MNAPSRRSSPGGTAVARHGSPSRRRLGVVAGLIVVVAATLAATSNALGATISVRVEGAVIDQPSKIVVDTSNIETVARVGVRYRYADLATPCAARFDQDHGDVAGQTEQFDDLSPRSDAFNVIWTQRRRVQICAWIDPVFGGGPSLGTASTQVMVLEPPGTLAIGAPPTAQVGFPVPLTFSGSGPARGGNYLFAKARPADGRPCAGYFAADPGQEIQIIRPELKGPFTVPGYYFTPATTGAHLVCAWLGSLASPDNGDYGGDPYPSAAASVTVTVVPQVPRPNTPLSPRHPQPVLSVPRVNGRTLRVTVKAKDRGVLTVRLVGKGRRVVILRRTVTAYLGRSYPLVYRRPDRLKTGAYVLEATFSKRAVSGVSKTTRRRVVFSR